MVNLLRLVLKITSWRRIMLNNSEYLFTHNSTTSFMCIVLAILVLGIVALFLSLYNIKKTAFVLPILSLAFILPLLGSSSLFGRLERITNDLHKKICLEIYPSSVYDDLEKTCYIRTISKSGKPIEIPIEEPSFKVIDINDFISKDK